VLVLVLSASGGSVGTAEAYYSDTERQSAGTEPARRRQQQARSRSETTRRGKFKCIRVVFKTVTRKLLGGGCFSLVFFVLYLPSPLLTLSFPVPPSGPSGSNPAKRLRKALLTPQWGENDIL